MPNFIRANSTIKMHKNKNQPSADFFLLKNYLLKKLIDGIFFVGGFLMKTAKKVLTITSICSIVIVVGLLISALFGANAFEFPLVAVLVSFGIICAGTSLTLNALNIMPKHRILAIVDMALLGLLVLLGIIISWSNFSTNYIFNKITLILGMIAILFNIIVAYYLKLGKKLLILQVVTYVLISVIDLLLTLQICDIKLFDIDWFVKLFIALCLITFLMFIVLAVLSKKDSQDSEDVVASKDEMIKISKAEYDALKTRISELEKENIELKSKLN